MIPIPPGLLEKYNHPAPRYTSYPTVMHWGQAPDAGEWIAALSSALQPTTAHGALYVHIPFCQSLCTFCGCNIRIVRNHALAGPYVATLLQEFTLYRQQLGLSQLRLAQLHLGGGTPTFLPLESLERLLDGILEHCDVAADADLSIEADPRNTTPEQLAVLRRHGFRRIAYGVQDFDARVMEIVNRPQGEDVVRRAVDAARTAGFDNISFDLIFGLPLQTADSLRHTFDIAASMRPERISFLPYAHVPWIKPSQRLYTEADLPESALRQQLFTLGREAMSGWGMVEIGIDHYAVATDPLAAALREHRLQRNFMGFTQRRSQALIGLGVSAIGDGGTAYAQNEKNAQQYEQRVQSGELPLQRGHVLSAGDRRVRHHLQQLLDASRTELEPDERTTSWWRHAEPFVNQMSDDGLLTLDGNLMQVTELGRAFLRHICAALDAYGHAQHAERVTAA